MIIVICYIVLHLDLLIVYNLYVKCIRIRVDCVGCMVLILGKRQIFLIANEHYIQLYRCQQKVEVL